MQDILLFWKVLMANNMHLFDLWQITVIVKADGQTGKLIPAASKTLCRRTLCVSTGVL